MNRTPSELQIVPPGFAKCGLHPGISRIAALTLALLPSLCVGEVILGDPPTAPTPEEVQQLRDTEGPMISGPGYPYVVNTFNREETRNFYNTVYGYSENFQIGWTGSHSGCVPGTTGAFFRDQVAMRINFFRAMAGIPATIIFNDTWNAKDQEAALIMSANNNLSHGPPSNWTCYTANGAEAAGKSNLALGNAGPDAISAYMEDFGGNNAAVGHRRWLIYPQTQVMGSGDVPENATQYSANATWVFDGNFGGTRPATRTNFVSWPPAGYVPYQIVYPRWSFGYPGAVFTSASVTLSSNGVNVPVTLEPVQGSIGENTLVWYPSSLNPGQPYSWPRPAQDTVYTVSLQNVVIGGTGRAFTYTVTVFDPAVPTPGRVEPVLTGPDQPSVNQTNSYTFTAVPGSTAHQWRASRRAPYTAIEGAENGLQNFTTNTSSGYNVLSSAVRASGTYSFHLAHVEASNQSISSTRTLLPAAGAAIQFKSRLGWATPNQVARLQVSVNDGGSWETIYEQAGLNNSGEGSFVNRNASLAAYAGRSIRYRLLYIYLGSTYYNTANNGVGWYVDDISFTNTEELTNSQAALLPTGTSLGFVPTQSVDYALEVRAQVYDEFYLDWGPAKRVTATASLPPPSLQFTGLPTVTATQFQIDFNVTNYRAGLVFELWKAPAPDGPWIIDPTASFQTVTANTRFRATAPTAGALRNFYQVSAR